MSAPAKKVIIKRLAKTLNMLSAEDVATVADFAEYLLWKRDDKILQKGIQHLVENSTAFEFLTDDDIYTFDDIKESC